MPIAPDKRSLEEALADEEHDEEFDLACMEDLATLLVEALTIPLAVNAGRSHGQEEQLIRLSPEALPLKARH